MEFLKLLLDWTADVSWPLVVLAVALTYRPSLEALFDRLGAVVERAGKEPFDLQLGEALKISFKDAIAQAQPQTVEEAVEVAEREAGIALSVFDTLARVPLKQHHRDLLLKIARGGDEGVVWHYKGKQRPPPGNTMGYLLNSGLVHRDGDRYFAHSVVRDFILETHERG
ncbi:MAG: hypothetical protein AAGA68_25595 [Pseudomonadota bacterium]